MNLVDTNVLIYAINEDSTHHAQCRTWIERAISRSALVGLSWTVILAFIRVTTHARVFEEPLLPGKAIAYVDEWISHPVVELIAPGPAHWKILRSLLASSGTAGNLTMDAHLAALAIERGATLVSTDRDFLRFSGLSVINPLD